MDLNKIISLWPYVLVFGVGMAVLYVPDVYRWWKNRQPAAAIPTAYTIGQAGQPLLVPAAPAVPVGTLAEYLKAISNHCDSVGDTAALAACDQIAPTLFHSKKPADTTTTKTA